MRLNTDRKFFMIPLAAFIFLVPFISIAQKTQPRQKYWTAGFNLGMIGWSPSSLTNLEGNNVFQRTANYGFGSVIDVKGHHSLALIANTSIGGNAGFMWRDKKSDSYTSIQLELQSNKACYEFDSPFTFPSHGDTTTKWVEADKYLKYSLALQRCWYRGESHFLGGSSYWYIRESFGQTLLHRNLGDPLTELIKKDHTEDWTEGGTGMRSRVVSINPVSWMLASEIGIKHFTANNSHSFDIGLVYYAPFSNTFTEEYEFFKKGVSVGKSQITYNGGSLMLNVRYTVNYKLKDRPIDTTAIKKKEEPLVKKVNDRHLDIQKKIEVGTDLVSVKIWDRGQVDGDKISLYLNDELILEDFTLTKEKKEVPLHLQAGKNYLVMHAINLGSVPPNTASMEIDDGNSKKRKSLTLISDTKKSGTIEIIYKP